MDIYLIAKVIGALGTIVGACAALWKYMLKPIKDWFTNTNKLWETIAAEFRPNGGGSMKDALNRIETRQLVDAQKARALTNDTLFGIWETDETGKCTYVNRTYQRMAGLSQDDLLGWGWINIIHEDDRAKLAQDWEQTLKQEREWHAEFRVVRPSDETTTPVISVGHPLKGRDGKLKGYVGQLVVKGDSDDVFFGLSP
jgi:PAS domain S-box-containing protein